MKKRFYYIPGDLPRIRRMAYALRRSAVPVADFPEDVQIQTVAGCNAKCVFCPNGNGASRLPAGRMPKALFEKIVDECVQNRVARISPYLMNEPLLDSDIGRKTGYIDRNRRRGLSIKMNTNAALLGDDMARTLVGSGLDRLNISFHGISKKTYEEAMHGLRFETALKNIENFTALLKAQHEKKPRVTITTVKTKLNEAEIPLLKQYWRSRGISVHVRQLENRSNADIAERGLAATQWKNYFWCKRLFTQAYILCNGDMILCCVDYGHTTVLGNVAQQSIRDIWNSDTALRIRRRFLAGNTQGLLCHTCFKQPG